MSRHPDTHAKRPLCATWLDTWLAQDHDPAQRDEILDQLDAQTRFVERLLEQGVGPRRRLHLSRFHAACSAASRVIGQTWNEHHRPH